MNNKTVKVVICVLLAVILLASAVLPLLLYALGM